MKKTLLGLGTVVSIIVPIVGVVSCGSTKKETPNPIVKNTTPWMDILPGTQVITTVPTQTGTVPTGTTVTNHQVPVVNTQPPAVVAKPKPPVPVVKPQAPATSINTGTTQTGSGTSTTTTVIAPKMFYAKATDFKVKIAGSNIFRLVIAGSITSGDPLSAQKWTATPIGTLVVGSSQSFKKTIGLVGSTTDVTVNAEVLQTTTRDLVLQDKTGSVVLRVPGIAVDADRFDSVASVIKTWVIPLMTPADITNSSKIKEFLQKIGLDIYDATILASQLL